MEISYIQALKIVGLVDILIFALVIFIITSKLKLHSKNYIVDILIFGVYLLVSVSSIKYITPKQVLNESYYSKKVDSVEKTGDNRYRVIFEDNTNEIINGTIEESYLSDKDNKYKYKVKVIRYYKDIDTFIENTRIVRDLHKLVLEKVEDEEDSKKGVEDNSDSVR